MRVTDTVEARDHAHELAREIAKHLPGWKWDRKANMTGDTLISDPCLDPQKVNGVPKTERRRLHLGRSYRTPGYFTIHGAYPWQVGRSIRMPANSPKSINISMSKTAERIARDIQRRYLSRYEEIHEEARTSLRIHNLHEATSRAIAKHLAALLHSTVSQNGSVYGPFDKRKMRIDVTEIYPDSVKLSIRCTPGDAERIIKAAKQSA